MFLRQTKSRVPDQGGRGFSDLEEWVLDTEGVNLAEVRTSHECMAFAGCPHTAHQAVSGSAPPDVIS